MFTKISILFAVALLIALAGYIIRASYRDISNVFFILSGALIIILVIGYMGIN